MFANLFTNEQSEKQTKARLVSTASIFIYQLLSERYLQPSW